jgi:predicted aldo/keto reductase-like oxidoreductase
MDINHQQGMTGYEILTEKDIPVIIMEPVKGGSLVKYNDRIEKLFTDYNDQDSIASWAFRWLGSLPNIKVILSGMTTMEQVEDNVNTFTDFKPLNDEEQEIIETVREEILALSQVECTSCNYCMPCPHGVNIPANFRLYNMHAMYNNTGHVKWAYGNLEKNEASADVCIDCGECIPKCPQNIEIPTRLSDFQDYLKDNGIK